MARGHVPEARRWLEHALAADRARPRLGHARSLLPPKPPSSRAHAAPMTSRRLAHTSKEATRIFVGAHDRSGAASARWTHAWITERKGDWAKALGEFEASVTEFRALSDDHFVLVGEAHRAFMYEQLGKPARARALHEDNLRLARSLGNKRIEALSLGALATFAIADDRLQEAWTMVQDAYAIHETFGFPAFKSIDLIRLAAILVRVGRADTAALLAARAARLTEDLTAVDEPWTARERAETTALIRAQLGDSAFEEASLRGRELNLRDAFSSRSLQVTMSSPNGGFSARVLSRPSVCAWSPRQPPSHIQKE